MRTPKEYNDLVDKRIITTEIVATVIYSLNKRAKNWRDKNREAYKHAKKIRNWNLLSNTYDDKVEKYPVLEYYKKKDYLLISLFKPQAIHLIDGVEYLFYKVHNSEFHFPGYIYELYGFITPQGLPVKDVTDFETKGEFVYNLVSVQFCNKVINLVKSGSFILVDGEIIKTPYSVNFETR